MRPLRADPHLLEFTALFCLEVIMSHMRTIAAAIAVALSVCSVLGATTQPRAAGAQREKICLNGVWDFKAAGTSATEIPSDGWNKLPVPSSWFWYGTELFVVPDGDSDHAWFRRSFFVPKEWSDGRKVKLLFLDLDAAHKVFVNESLAHEANAMRLCLNVDITGLVRFGEQNNLALWTQRVESAHESGIVRSVYLVTTPAVHVKYSHALPSVKDMTLTVKTRVKNEDTVARTVTVKPAVRDNAKTVLELPEVSATIEPGQSVEVETSSPWKDPVLWGFGPYGRPYLYHLCTQLEGEGVADETFDRFGFREFRTDGAKFLFNGKEYFVKGDLISRAWPVTENPEFVAAFYQGMRFANVNFQRLHGTNTNSFDSPYWYQVADELGHLVEAQLCRTRTEPDDPEHLALWTSYVNYHFNHPSLVMWCGDNESIRPGYSTDLAQAETVMPGWNRLASHIRRLDPTRIVEFHDGCALFAGVHLGVFDRENYMTFNIHAYGNLVQAVQRAKRDYAFDDSVPVLAGEVFPFPANIDMVADPVGTFIEQRRRGQMLHKAIGDLAGAGVGGTILCALEDVGFLGFSDPDTLQLGPWSDRILVRDETKPDKPVIGNRECKVKARWPSLSGEGMKIDVVMPHCGATGGAGGYGFNFNWFDPTEPMFRTNLIDVMVKDAYEKADGRQEPPLGPQRAPQVIVCFGVEGKPVEGAYVELFPQDGQAPPPSAVTTDSDGTAWFHLWDLGRYRAVVNHEGRMFEKSFVLDARPKLTDKPGYDYITWIDMGGIDIAKRKAELAQPAELIGETIRRPEELLTGGGMEIWHSDKIGGWDNSPVQETKIVKSGKYAAKLVGNVAQLVCHIKMDPGSRYKISGWIYKGAGDNSGCIGLRANNWDWLVKLDGSQEPGQWEYVETTHTATGAEYYFYCYNYYMGDDAVCYFDDVSVRRLPDGERPALQPGPFEVGNDGFIGHWLICGPFPNLLVEKDSGSEFLGHRNDLLKEYGGEANFAPKYGLKLRIVFPVGGPWLEGEETLTWRDVHGGGMIQLADLTLPSRGITVRPPNLVCAYAACTIESPRAHKVKVAIGSDDGNKVFLNGKLVGENEVMRGAEADQDIYPAELKQGENVLLVKIFQHVGDWVFCVRFLDEQDQPLRDLNIKLPG